MPKYFDIHSHLNFLDYEKDFKEVMQRLKDTGTHTIVVGTDYESSQAAVKLADKYEEVYASIGVHPVGKLTSFEVDKFASLVTHNKVVTVGECGLDFKHAEKDTDYERQKQLFLDQVDFALEYDKPLMIHARDSYAELLEILEPLKKKHGDKLRGNVHFFAGDTETARRLFDIGFSISFTGVITFARDYDDVIKMAPLSHIMSETDAPYVAPVPYRGQRNEPSYVDKVVERIALIRGEELDEVRQALVQNARRMIGY